MDKIVSLERSSIHLEQAAAGAAPSGFIEATVTTWGARETVDGRKMNYQPEGFADWLHEFNQAGRPLPMHFNHESNDIPVGEWTEFVMTDEGMTGKGRLFLNTTDGRDVYSILKESPKMFDGVSVGAYAEEACYVDEEGNPSGDMDNSYFRITKGGLAEVSVVTHAANPMAVVSKLEFHLPDGTINAREIEKALREAGASKSVATAAVSIFKRVIAEDVTTPMGEPEAEAVESDAMLKALEQRTLLKKLSERTSK